MGEWERLFGLDPQLIFDALVLAVNIFILFTLLSYILFNPAREFLEKRRTKVEGDINQAKEALEQARAMKAEYEEKLKGADAQISVMMANARQKAIKNEDAILVEARNEAARIVKHGHNQIELERKKAADDMKKQIVDVATLMATKAARVSISVQEQENLIDETLKELGDDTWQEQ